MHPSYFHPYVLVLFVYQVKRTVFSPKLQL